MSGDLVNPDKLILQGTETFNLEGIVMTETMGVAIGAGVQVGVLSLLELVFWRLL